MHVVLWVLCLQADLHFPKSLVYLRGIYQFFLSLISLSLFSEYLEGGVSQHSVHSLSPESPETGG